MSTWVAQLMSVNFSAEISAPVFVEHVEKPFFGACITTRRIWPFSAGRPR